MTSPKRGWREYSLKGVFLRFIVHENREYHDQILYDWLLQKAKDLGIPAAPLSTALPAPVATTFCMNRISGRWPVVCLLNFGSYAAKWKHTGC